MLRMPEKEFWRCTPRKLKTLASIHAEVRGVEQQQEPMQYIDQILGW